MPESTINTGTLLICDADVLLKLAQNPANLPAINAFHRAVDEGTYKLIVPQPVLNAFQREKDTASERYWNAVRGTIKKFRMLQDQLVGCQDIATIADRAQKEVDHLVSTVPNTISAVEELLNKGELVVSTPEMKITAADKVAQHVAPATSAQNSSINDCIIWEVVKERISQGDVIFVTDNYTDFSDPKHRAKLHPHLVGEMSADAKFCYHSLEDFREKHMKQVPIVVAPPAEIFAAYDYCPNCGGPLAPDKIPRPSMFGGWSYHQYCGNCHRYIDTGDPYDE